MTKVCTKCHLTKPFSDFNQHPHQKFGLSSACTLCLRASNRQRYQEHRERLLQWHREYYQANRERLKARVKAYQQAHPEIRQRWAHADRVAHPEKYRRRYARLTTAQHEILRRSKRKYDRAHVDERRAITAAWRAYQKASPIIERIMHRVIAERDHWICHICRKKVTTKTWSLDHLNPLSQGGLHVSTNIALAHKLCNSRRGAGRLPAQLRLLP